MDSRALLRALIGHSLATPQRKLKSGRLQRAETAKLHLESTTLCERATQGTTLVQNPAGYTP